ncbi:hypothetical protein [Neolewinella persica]|uniref:hypothetical protein n=1 Tax=Neolewinella persica TaxID=70998 RepID=UPI00039CF20C|nr:hypothetical protein [Neolewinella persica]
MAQPALTAGIFSLIVITLTLASGCDYVQSLQAIIVDEETQLPIDSVRVHESNENITIFSDSTGFIDYYNLVGGWNPPDLKMTFTKPGYEVLEMSFPPSSLDTLTLALNPE